MENASEALIVEFAQYNLWANLELLKACEGLSEAQLQTSEPGAFGTIRDTLMHLIGSEGYYLFLLSGQKVDRRLLAGGIAQAWPRSAVTPSTSARSWPTSWCTPGSTIKSAKRITGRFIPYKACRGIDRGDQPRR